jgi:hypothetical protein
MTNFLRNLWLQQEEGQDIAEYAVMLAVILSRAVALGSRNSHVEKDAVFPRADSVLCHAASPRGCYSA